MAPALKRPASSLALAVRERKGLGKCRLPSPALKKPAKAEVGVVKVRCASPVVKSCGERDMAAS